MRVQGVCIYIYIYIYIYVGGEDQKFTIRATPVEGCIHEFVNLRARIVENYENLLINKSFISCALTRPGFLISAIICVIDGVFTNTQI